MTADYRVQFHGFDNGAHLAAELAGEIAARLAAALAERDTASLAVSGGTTPVPLFAALSKVVIDWGRVVITLADERWVRPTDSASNERLVRTHLLQNQAAAARFVGLKTDHALARDGEAECGERIAAIARPLDVLVLGMGEDGHTASLFTGAANLPLATDLSSGRLCLAMQSATASHERMTLTLPALLYSRRIILLLTGQAKLATYRKALGEKPRSVEVLDAMPIRHVLARTAGEAVQVYWAP